MSFHMNSGSVCHLTCLSLLRMDVSPGFPPIHYSISLQTQLMLFDGIVSFFVDKVDQTGLELTMPLHLQW